MPVSADTLKLLMDSGLRGDDLVAVVRAFERDMEGLRVGHAVDAAAERRREYDRERKRRERQSTGQSTGQSAETPSPSSLSPTPPNPTTPTPKENPPTGVKRKGSRLPEDWQPVPEAAFVEGLSRRDAEREAERFRDYWRSQPGQRGVKADWDATWRNWCRKAADDKRRRPGTDPPKRGSAAIADLCDVPMEKFIDELASETRN